MVLFFSKKKQLQVSAFLKPNLSSHQNMLSRKQAETVLTHKNASHRHFNREVEHYCVIHLNLLSQNCLLSVEFVGNFQSY
jgi:hypothetical protein